MPVPGALLLRLPGVSRLLDASTQVRFPQLPRTRQKCAWFRERRPPTVRM
jgi:hypothetical protein